MDASRTTIDLKRLAAEVSAQHGIRMDPDDPMMAVVTLNRLVFEQAVGQVLEGIKTSVRDFETAADKVQIRAGSALAQEVRDCGLTIRQEVGRAFEDLRRVGPNGQSDVGGGRPTHGEQKWLALGLALALFLFCLGIWVGTRLS
jgi:hypothetical protein